MAILDDKLDEIYGRILGYFDAIGGYATPGRQLLALPDFGKSLSIRLLAPLDYYFFGYNSELGAK